MRLTLLVLAALLATAAPAAAHPGPNGLPLPLGGPPEQTVASTSQVQPQPTPVPRPDCGPGSRPETDIQGRVPAGNPVNVGVLSVTACTVSYSTSAGSRFR